MQRRDVQDLSSQLRLACMRISRRVRVEGNGELPPHQYAVLTGMENGPRTLRELAEREGVSAPAMTRTVEGLAEAGLAIKERDPEDGRKVGVSLSPAGWETLERIKRDRDQWMLSRLDRLSEEDLAILTAATPILERIERDM